MVTKKSSIIKGRGVWGGLKKGKYILAFKVLNGPGKIAFFLGYKRKKKKSKSICKQRNIRGKKRGE